MRKLSFDLYIIKNKLKLITSVFIIQVSLAKPPSDKKKKEEILRARERRMMQMMQVRTGAPGLVHHEKMWLYCLIITPYFL